MSVEIKIVDEYPKDIFDDLIKRNLETDGVFIRSWEHLGAGDSSFSKTGRNVRIAAFDNGKMIALSMGVAETKNRFMMLMSLVEKEYRQLGIYTKMLQLMLENTKEFDEIDSCHHLFNNKIIAAKLKHDFHIVMIENSAMVGPRLRLRYFNNKKILEIMKFRVGLRDNPLTSSDELSAL